MDYIPQISHYSYKLTKAVISGLLRGGKFNMDKRYGLLG